MSLNGPAGFWFLVHLQFMYMYLQYNLYLSIVLHTLHKQYKENKSDK